MTDNSSHYFDSSPALNRLFDILHARFPLLVGNAAGSFAALWIGICLGKSISPAGKFGSRPGSNRA
jgi:hypothetical protein